MHIEREQIWDYAQTRIFSHCWLFFFAHAYGQPWLGFRLHPVFCCCCRVHLCNEVQEKKMFGILQTHCSSCIVTNLTLKQNKTKKRNFCASENIKKKKTTFSPIFYICQYTKRNYVSEEYQTFFFLFFNTYIYTVYICEL